MNSRKLHMTMRRLSPTEQREIERRERKYRDRLARQGYTTRAVVDESGCFGVVLVEDPESQKIGLLLPNGDVRWIHGVMPPGALADAAVTGVVIERVEE